ncbi:IclR family transcriptional regulator [Streptomyces griseus]|uniref:IclR-family transcriptional regulator n=1 Tax=Streptomyces griseus subsp. griseus (strain JCM 4626 / CBS 651.72 / NBRC 13350 / KCC S-0626 / ISP 5235) TaxID=455632 RepID=B1VL83_STRGG|nr:MULTISPECIES: helix-turn-helix domain-containing protein [Streptomyces]MYR14742.1 helix-turn-helix domain-containing protein [Streptomyces sp. SID724]MYR50910.1 helix-turn-helix domain-containing protein [Streptomyces sp. SID4928]MYT79188.1 helix-turn-helix domain-containing protein [Streptomyces sp. SID8364]EGE42869.1 transcriptional regulator, IclR family [Streptomyces sp. ACT-1]MBW3705766.1 IclR family transcriptional regulator [Streptomyces griseus]
MSVATRQPKRVSGIGVLDKASALLDVVEKGPVSLAELVSGSGFARPTVHRIALGLESLGLLARDFRGRFVLGPRLGNMVVEVQRDRLVKAATPVLSELRELTGLDARLFRRSGAMQVCVGARTEADGDAEELPVGTARSLRAGPVAQVLLAWEEPGELYEGLRSARFTAAQLSLVRRRGWVHGPDATMPGAVSIAVPVRAMGKRVVAALALTGAHPRMPAIPSRLLLGAVIDAAGELGDVLVDTRPVRSRAAVSQRG